MDRIIHFGTAPGAYHSRADESEGAGSEEILSEKTAGKSGDGCVEIVSVNTAGGSV